MLNATINQKLKNIILVQVLVICLAIASQLDISLNKKSFAPTWWLMLTGLLAGLFFGWIASLTLTRRLARYSFRLVFPFWLGMLTFAVGLSGLFFSLRVAVPMDWRPVISTALISTLPGTVLGGLVSWWLSQDIINAEPLPLKNKTLAVLNDNLEQVRAAYPGAEGRLFISDEEHYVAQVRVPRTSEEVMFYITCDDQYPRLPPSTVAIELVLRNGRTQTITYDAPIVHYWSSKYGLKHIIQEALQILNH
jgi:hypothetical protein